MVRSEESELIAEHARARAAMFPGSHQVQGMPWSTAVHATAERVDRLSLPPDGLESYFYTTVYHSDFDPEWPISTDWPAVIRGLRGALGATQARFAEMCDIGRATVERWETGRMVPFGGNALKLLTLVSRHLITPVQAGQALNLAAAVVLPHLTRPTAEYAGLDLIAFLKSGKHDHTYLGPGLLSALVQARILLRVDIESDELEDTYFPLAARLRDDSALPEWAPRLIDDLLGVSDTDRKLVLDLATRLTRGT